MERSAAERAQQLADVALAVYEAGGQRCLCMLLPWLGWVAELRLPHSRPAVCLHVCCSCFPLACLLTTLPPPSPPTCLRCRPRHPPAARPGPPAGDSAAGGAGRGRTWRPQGANLHFCTRLDKAGAAAHPACAAVLGLRMASQRLLAANCEPLLSCAAFLCAAEGVGSGARGGQRAAGAVPYSGGDGAGEEGARMSGGTTVASCWGHAAEACRGLPHTASHLPLCPPPPPPGPSLPTGRRARRVQAPAVTACVCGDGCGAVHAGQGPLQVCAQPGSLPQSARRR